MQRKGRAANDVDGIGQRRNRGGRTGSGARRVKTAGRVHPNLIGGAARGCGGNPRCDDKAKLVINISYGTFAGPHDGSSLIEAALDELLTLRNENFAIVLAAGNARQERCHVERTVRHDRPVRLQWQLVPDDPTDTFLEVWYPPGKCSLRVRVRPPNQEWSNWVAPDGSQVLTDLESKQVVASVFHDQRVPNGKDAMILICAAPTFQPVNDSGALAPAGHWEAEIELVNGAAEDDRVTLHAWIERDDPGDAASGPQSHFVASEAGDEECTLSSIATGQHTLVAGGFRLDDGERATYSSLGPKRGAAASPAAHVPAIFAACEEDYENPNVRAAAVRSNDPHRMAGTSVAAPVLARRLFNYMAASKTPVARDGWAAVLDELGKKDPFLRLP